jgi:hypothetical protein
VKIGKGDAVTYVGLVISAALQAAEPLRKEVAMPPEAHPILSSPLWAYLPMALLCFVGFIWLVKTVWPSKRGMPQTLDSAPLEIFSNQRLGGIVVMDGKRFISCKWDDVMVCWNGGQFSIEPLDGELKKSKGL